MLYHLGNVYYDEESHDGSGKNSDLENKILGVVASDSLMTQKVRALEHSQAEILELVTLMSTE